MVRGLKEVHEMRESSWKDLRAIDSTTLGRYDGSQKGNMYHSSVVRLER